MPVSETTYRALSLEDPERQWELHRGRLREKPAMSYDHYFVTFELGYQIRSQIDTAAYQVRTNGPRVRRTDETYYIPDVIVYPTHLSALYRGKPNLLEVYDAPLPLIAEVWSPSTGDYDVNEKLPEYQRRGDLEIWRIHPFERTLTAWRRQPDGSYDETVIRGGKVSPVALPNVTIDLDALFE
jgi:Uma2 family endonuclease